jgi:hypothetical protein
LEEKISPIRQTRQQKAQALKTRLCTDLRVNRLRILAAVGSLSADQQRQVYLGSWTVRELLAHLGGWDVTNRQAIEAVRAGQLPAFYHYRDTDWRRYNALLVERYLVGDVPALLSFARQTLEELLTVVAALDVGELERDFGVRYRGYRVTIARLLQSELQDEQQHLQQIIDFFHLSG